MVKPAGRMSHSSTRPHPDQVLAAMLAYLKSRPFVGDAKLIHETFYYLKQQYPDLLCTFGFAEGPAHVFSRALERSLARLQLSRIIGMENPDFERYTVRSAVQPYLEEVLSKFTPREQESLKAMANAFAERCGVEEE